MFIISQFGNISINSKSISRFHVDEDGNIFSYSAESDETMLLGAYSAPDKALDALVAVVDAIEAGKTYRMPADDATEATADPVEPTEAAQPDEANGEETADTTADVQAAQRKHRGRAPSGKFSLFCDMYPGYLRGELGVTRLAKEIGCSTATIYTYLRKMRALVDAATTPENM